MLCLRVSERCGNAVSERGHMSNLSAQEAAPKVATPERDAGLDRSTETKSFSKTSALPGESPNAKREAIETLKDDQQWAKGQTR
jgi:hypothetical protein